MLSPELQASTRPLYAVGNTPAISLTRCLPQGLDADVLLVGCGDVRHLLYTAYANLGFPARRLDITACDVNPHVIARNVVFLTLVLDGGAAVSPVQIWNIYYHLYVDADDMHALEAQAEKLVGLSGSLDDWHTGTYGTTIRFCDADSLADVRGIWAEYVHGARAKESPAYQSQFGDKLGASRRFKDKWCGPGFNMHSTSRSGAPLSRDMVKDLIKALARYWQTGLARPAPPATKLYANPTFAEALSERSVLAWPSDPLLSFHLATAEANLTELSPLRLDDDKAAETSRLFEAAQVQFRAWVDAFRAAASASSTTIRFITADGFALCHTLQHNVETGAMCAHWYRRKLGFQALELAESEYGKEGTAPTKFDVIDTSNIADYCGVINLLVSAGPLLKDAPSSTVYTEIMTRGGASDSAKFGALLCGHTKTVSILLGLAPVECWTNATTESVVDECLAAIASSDEATLGEGGLKIHSRLAWKHGRLFSGRAPSAPSQKLAVKPEDLEILAYQIYRNMLADTRAPIGAPKYNRVSFLAFLKAVCKTVAVQPAGSESPLVAQLLAQSLGRPDASEADSLHRHDLLLEMAQLGLYSSPELDPGSNDSPLAPFNKWAAMLATVSVTLVVPPEQWQAELRRTGGFVLLGLVRCRAANKMGWQDVTRQSLYSNMQVAFGAIEVHGTRDHDNFLVTLPREDPAGFSGSSALVATFNVAAATLTAHDTHVSIISYKSVAAYIESGYFLEPFFEAHVLDEDHVFITKNPPGQKGPHHIVGGLPPALSAEAAPQQTPQASTSTTSYEPEPEPEPEPELSANIDGSTGEIVSVTLRQNITSDRGKRLLADIKSPITLRPTSSSPFTVELVLGAPGGVIFGPQPLVLPLTAPVPIQLHHTKTRVARRSGYVEVIVATPATDAVAVSSPEMDAYLLPTALMEWPGKQDNTKKAMVPATLNVPHVSLDTLPILAVDSKSRLKFLSTLSSLIFSARERRLREAALASDTTPDSARLNFKESLFTMFNVAAGLQGGATGLFALHNPSGGGIHMLVFVNAVRLDGAAASVVLDAAVIPFTHAILSSGRLEAFLLVLRTLECCTLTVDEGELGLWKRALPALAERCRTWEHGERCQYSARWGGKPAAPVSLEAGESVLCSCGAGKLPERFIALPDWEVAARFATRVAISPVFATPFVEELIDGETARTFKAASKAAEAAEKAGGAEKKEEEGDEEDVGDVEVPALAMPEACRACGRIDATLKACGRCRAVKYCTAACQKKDWKKHRMECEDAAAA
ncbi:hypothetical protein B0T24DRAFT_665870 [Lasiosphaeria ovina]|uniref:MYND-type domain-containing protein n=1 Tax=Lasiosphaeria ovina TaxID=92902 RepID=A0AAE0NB83_9PEZI|nr:hypothetical protein B0T24DRAFT_665870 [Lasiosphaeria ovina]